MLISLFWLSRPDELCVLLTTEIHLWRWQTVCETTPGFWRKFIWQAVLIVHIDLHYLLITVYRKSWFWFFILNSAVNQLHISTHFIHNCQTTLSTFFYSPFYCNYCTNFQHCFNTKRYMNIWIRLGQIYLKYYILVYKCITRAKLHHSVIYLACFWLTKHIMWWLLTIKLWFLSSILDNHLELTWQP